MSYRQIEHTADVGIEVQAPTLDELFAQAPVAMTACFVDLSGIGAATSFEVLAVADDLDLLLVEWLDEILVCFELQGLIAVQGAASVERKDGRWSVRGTLRGEALDPARHRVSTPIKAVTFHGLEVTRGPDGWIARVLFDI